MTSHGNKYGLSRHIPENIKYILRKEAGFGCVICGRAICSYEHIDPEFKDAKDHDPEKMAFLCEGCHSKITRKFWSKEKVFQAKKKPWCIQKGKCHSSFDVADSIIEVTLAGNKFYKSDDLIVIDNTEILKISPPEEMGAPYRLSGNFYDKIGKMIFSIKENEWVGEVTNFDINYVGGRIIIKNSYNETALQILCDPPRRLIIEKINLYYKGAKIIGDQNSLEFRTKSQNVKFKTIGYKYISAGIRIADNSITIKARPGSVFCPISKEFPDIVKKIHPDLFVTKN